MLEKAVLVLALLASGLQAGLYYAFSCAVMPGLARGDDRTFVATMQQVNEAIINPWFLTTFFGAPVLAALAGVLHAGRPGPALGWIIVGFIFAAATFVITVAANVPLNDALAAAGDPDRTADLVTVRARFEATWTRWNTVRTVASTVSLGCLGWALLVVGQDS